MIFIETPSSFRIEAAKRCAPKASRPLKKGCALLLLGIAFAAADLSAGNGSSSSKWTCYLNKCKGSAVETADGGYDISKEPGGDAVYFYRNIDVEPGKTYKISMRLTQCDETLKRHLMINFPGNTERNPKSLSASFKDGLAEVEVQTLPGDATIRVHLVAGGNGKAHLGSTTMEEAGASQAKTTNLFASNEAKSGISLFNGGFEVGTAGYETVRAIRPDTNPKLEYTPLRTDLQEKKSGRRSLRLANPYAEQVELHSLEFKLKANTLYHVSGYSKSDRRDGLAFKASLGHYSFKNQNINAGKDLKPGTSWEPFDFDLKTKGSDEFYHLIFTIPAGSAGSVWLDDLSVEEAGKNAGKRVEAGIYTERKLYLDAGQSASIALKLHNPTTEKFDKDIKILAIDDYFGTRYEITSLKAQVDANSTQDFAAKWPIPRFGAYRIELSEDSGVSFCPGYLANMKKIEPVKYRNDKFMPGMNGGLSLAGPPRIPAYGWEISGQSPESFIEALSAAGCRMVRGHDNGIMSWRNIEPEPGEFKFSWAEQAIGLLAKNHIAYIPVLVAACQEDNPRWQSHPRSFSDWQAALCSRGKDWKNKDEYLHPPVESWRAYARALATRFKDEVPAWEMLNEPQFKMSAEEYMRYLSSGAEEIRKVDPDAFIAGICSTSDSGADIGKFATEVMEKGALKYLDAVTFHPYASRELSSNTPADQQIEAFRKNIAAFESKPIWEGELYYLFDGPSMAEWYRSGKFLAHHLASRYLVDCGEGCAQSSPIQASQLWRRILTPNYEGGKCEEANPSPSMVAFSMISETLTGATPVYKKQSGGIVNYGFRGRDGKLFAATWKYGKNQDSLIDLGSIEAKDIFGNRLENGWRRLSCAPIYLFQGSYGEAEFLDKLKNLRIAPDSPVFIVPVVRLATVKGKLTALLTVRNDAAEDNIGTIELDGACKTLKPFQFKIGKGKTETFQIAVERGSGPQTVVTLQAGGKRERQELKTIEVAFLSPGEAFHLRTLDGKAFGTGRFAVAAKRLELELEIPDATPARPDEKREAWEQDGVEFFVDANAGLNPDNASTPSSGYFRFFVFPRLPADKRIKVWKNKLGADEGDIACECQSNKSNYKLLLSISLAKIESDSIGLEIKVNDAEGDAKPKRTAFFSGGVPNPFENRSGFGILSFSKEKPLDAKAR